MKRGEEGNALALVSILPGLTLILINLTSGNPPTSSDKRKSRHQGNRKEIRKPDLKWYDDRIPYPWSTGDPKACSALQPHNSPHGP